MSPSAQDPHDFDGERSAGGVPPRRGPFGFGPHLDALRPDAPTPRAVAVVRTLMFIGGSCGLALGALFLMGLSVPAEAMNEALQDQVDIAAEQGVELVVTVDLMRSLMGVLALVTGAYGLLSTLLATRIQRRTVGVFWGVVLFQAAAGLLLLWNLLGGEWFSLVPLGFTAAMVAFMFTREGRAYYGLL
ncbi:hypothetical protein BJF83_13180 [Nocardiopsis sp. CNR-923]|uniref:hypothetical protein n=1 Tax=Nocardiopsis sp. CNR-923 TaxID=1904965 RepID=UPI00095EFD95|nr:hypothetical protein [Nocardiopsis sp. CNR-923]OLT28904.1 hypothetical protein BJF83_13180 [Nocardiopsis sp. CNR-923]